MEMSCGAALQSRAGAPVPACTFYRSAVAPAAVVLASVAHALACRGGIHATIRKPTGCRNESRRCTLKRATSISTAQICNLEDGVD
jgi:hypothetical protein